MIKKKSPEQYQFKVEHDIKFTEERKRGRRMGSRNYHRPYRKYPFDIMKPGDSFFTPVMVSEVPAKVQSNILASSRSHPGKYATRTCGSGIRCWRLK